MQKIAIYSVIPKVYHYSVIPKVYHYSLIPKVYLWRIDLGDFLEQFCTVLASGIPPHQYTMYVLDY